MYVVESLQENGILPENNKEEETYRLYNEYISYVLLESLVSKWK